jgi:hypothetical protein
MAASAYPDRPGYRFPGPPPEEALQFFDEKELWPSFSYLDVWREEHATIFTVAKAMEMDVVTTLHAAARKALAEGQTFQQFQKELTPILQKAGWWGKQTMVDPLTGEEKLVDLGSPRRLKTIFDTNMRTARAAGQWERIQRTKDSFPFLLYTIGPSREHRVEHVGWHGTCLPVDDPWWRSHMPPNGWGCKCRVRQVSQWEYERLQKNGVPAPDAPMILGPDGQPTGRREQKTTPIRTSPPPEGQPQRWVNTRTGQEEMVPYGFDPGWNYNPGEARREQQAQKLLQEKTDALIASITSNLEATGAQAALLEQIAAEIAAAAVPDFPPLAPIRKSTDALLHLDDFEQIGPQRGSNPGGLYRDKLTGEEFYIKFPKSEARADNEILASKLYELAGVNAAQVTKLVDADGRIGVASKIVPDVKSVGADIKKAKGAKDGFAADAWLANWDAVGAGFDNLLIDLAGDAIRVDVGGSLLFRAQGGAKGAMFGEEVTELFTLRDKNINPQAAAVFGDMTPAALKKSLKKVSNIKDTDIDRLVDTFGPADAKDDLKRILKARRDYLRQALADMDKPPMVPGNLPVDKEALRQLLGESFIRSVVSGDNAQFGARWGLSEDELAGLVAYSGNWFKDMNAVLRGAKQATPEMRSLINAAANGCIKADPYDGTAWRGVGSTVPKGFEAAHTKVGNVVRWDGFTSTSDSSGANFGGRFQFTILDAKGGRISEISQYPSEREVLLPPGSMFVVVDAVEDRGVWRITLRMLDAAPGKKKTKAF